MAAAPSMPTTAATSPGADNMDTTGTAGSTAAATTAAGAAAATTTAATTTATGQSQFLGERRRSGIFLVEDVERPQADIGNFLIAEKDFVILTL
jgi:hypothetical protein